MSDFGCGERASGGGERVLPVLDQRCDPGQVSARLRQELIACWVSVSNAGGAVGFPFLPVDTGVVSPVADELIASLGPHRRLLVAVVGDVLAGWVHVECHPDPLIAHWGWITRVQTLPAFQGRGIGSALMTYARQVAGHEMGLEQLHLAARGGMGLEYFYARLGWREIGRWPGALRLAPGDDRDEVLMALSPL